MNSENTSYIWQRSDWPHWQFDTQALAGLLADVHQAQSRLSYQMEELDLAQRKHATMQFFVEDVLGSSEIEGERLDPQGVRASVARHLGMSTATEMPADQQIDGIVNLVIDASTNHAAPLTPERLFAWHDALFPISYGIISSTNSESWRDDATGPMQVVSVRGGQLRIHFEAPPASRVNEEMTNFLRWFNAPTALDAIIKAGLAHLWFLTIHPFGDGNGRIARAISDMVLAHANGTLHGTTRFYSYSAQIQHARDDYYDILELTQKGNLEVTVWLRWFLVKLKKAMDVVDIVSDRVIL